MTISPFPKFRRHLFSENALAAHMSRDRGQGQHLGTPSSRRRTHLNERFEPATNRPRGVQIKEENRRTKKRGQRRFAPITMADRSDHDQSI